MHYYPARAPNYTLPSKMYIANCVLEIYLGIEFRALASEYNGPNGSIISS